MTQQPETDQPGFVNVELLRIGRMPNTGVDLPNAVTYVAKVLSPREILEQTYTFLAPEGRWIRKEWYDPRTNFAQKQAGRGIGEAQKACSVGAMLLATQMDGLQWYDDKSWDRYFAADPNFRRACELLLGAILDTDEVAMKRWRLAEEGAVEDASAPSLIEWITNWNDDDRRLHHEVMQAFEVAIKAAIKDEEVVR